MYTSKIVEMILICRELNLLSIKKKKKKKKHGLIGYKVKVRVWESSPLIGAETSNLAFCKVQIPGGNWYSVQSLVLVEEWQEKEALIIVDAMVIPILVELLGSCLAGPTFSYRTRLGILHA